MTKQNFNTMSLDQLVNESIAEADQMKNEIQSLDPNEINDSDEDDYLTELDKPFSDKSDLIDKNEGDKISFVYVYRKLGDLIDMGNASLQLLQSIDPETLDPSVLGAIASLMNSIKGCISEFTKVHQQNIKFNQAIKMEKIKFENRKKYLDYKHDLSNGQRSTSISDLYEIEASDLTDFLIWKRERDQEKNKQK